MRLYPLLKQSTKERRRRRTDWMYIPLRGPKSLMTTGGDSSLALPEPETFDAEAIEKYASEIKADESKAAS